MPALSPDSVLDLDGPALGNNVVLRVIGDSLLAEHICDGDYLIINTSEPRTGDTVVALLNGRAIVGRITDLGYRVMIESREPLVPPRYVSPGDVRGVLVAVIRKPARRV